MVDVSNELIDNKEQFYGMAISSTSEHNFGDEVRTTDESQECRTKKDERGLL